MQRRLSIFISFSCLLFFLLPNCKEEPEANLLPAQLLHSDLDSLEYLIRNLHGDPYRFTSQEAIDQHFSKARREVNKAKGMDAPSFFGLLLPIIAELKDGHTRAFLSDFPKYEGLVGFPLKLSFHDYRPFIIDNYGQEDIPRGAELITVNGVSAGRFFEALADLVPSDGNIKLAKYRKLENLHFLNMLVRAQNKSSKVYQVAIQTEEGLKTFKLKGLGFSALMTAIEEKDPFIPPSSPIELKFPDSLKGLGYLRVSSFSPNRFRDDFSKYRKVIDSLVTTLQQKKTKHLILDLRNNGGGDDYYHLYLLRYLMKTPFALYEKLNFKEAAYQFLLKEALPGISTEAFKKTEDGLYSPTDKFWGVSSPMGTFTPFANAFDGELIILINAFTFSEGAACAAILHHSKRGIFVGEETGGSYIGSVSGYSPPITFPHSRIRINIPLGNILRPVFNSHSWTDRGVLPDHPIAPTAKDILNGRDVVLEKALESVRASRG
jgi:C-terminal processing protease CtpA/Prc